LVVACLYCRKTRQVDFPFRDYKFQAPNVYNKQEHKIFSLKHITRQGIKRDYESPVFLPNLYKRLIGISEHHYARCNDNVSVAHLSKTKYLK
jgi:hypothetical protein